VIVRHNIASVQFWQASRACVCHFACASLLSSLLVPRPTTRMRHLSLVYPRHSKGALLLLLLSSNSVDAFFWNKRHQQCSIDHHNENYPQVLQQLTHPRRSKRIDNTQQQHHDAEQYCRMCASCLDVTQATDCLTTLRGGGGGGVVTSSSTTTTTTNHHLTLWKLFFQFFLTTLNIACWYLPLQQTRRLDANSLGMANAFSGGVFLSLAFGHLIPECIGLFDALNVQCTTPLLLVLAGYLVIFVIEKVAFDTHGALEEMQSGEETVEKPETQVTARAALILLGALAVHSVLEMMALGLADTKKDAALLTLSISLHQPAESLALLVAFVKSGLSKSQIIRYLGIFSAMGPLGVVLGICVNEYASPFVDATMLAIVAGTFVYVGATEVIPEEFEGGHRGPKAMALLGGMVIVLAITQATASMH